MVFHIVTMIDDEIESLMSITNLDVTDKKNVGHYIYIIVNRRTYFFFNIGDIRCRLNHMIDHNK